MGLMQLMPETARSSACNGPATRAEHPRRHAVSAAAARQIRRQRGARARRLQRRVRRRRPLREAHAALSRDARLRPQGRLAAGEAPARAAKAAHLQDASRSSTAAPSRAIPRTPPPRRIISKSPVAAAEGRPVRDPSGLRAGTCRTLGRIAVGVSPWRVSRCSRSPVATVCCLASTRSPAAGQAPEPLPEALTQMIETERAFAARALVIGWKQAFLEYFSPTRSASTRPAGGARADREESGPAEGPSVDLGAALRRRRRQRRAWLPDRPGPQHPRVTRRRKAAPLQLRVDLEAASATVRSRW